MSAAIQPGDVLGQWTLLEPLGQGGFGSVWKARGAGGQLAAIKLLDSAPGREVLALDRLCHPALPALLDAQGGAAPFIALQLAPGRPLSHSIRSGRAPEDKAVAVTAILADALAAVHQAGIWHGDLKPDNVIVGSIERGEVMLVDFGMVGEKGGTFQYAAPERLTGDPPSAAADIYALGLMLWEMLHRGLPWAGLEMSQALLQRQRETPTPAYGSPWLQGLLQAMLQVDPAARPSAEHIADACAAHGAPLPVPGPELLARRAGRVHVSVPGVDEGVRGWTEEGGLLAVVGGRGAGRTHALQQAAALLRAAGRTWLWLRPSAEPWGAIKEALASPDLPGAPHALPREDNDWHRAIAAAGLLEARAPAGLHVIVDDLDEVDAGSRLAIEALARQGVANVLVGCGAAPPWSPLFKFLPPFSAEETGELLAQILGGGSAVTALAAQLYEACGGTPALCVDLLISACRDGALVRRAGRWQVEEAALARLLAAGTAEVEVDIPAGSAAARVGAALALHGDPLAIEDLPELTGCSPAEAAAALAELAALRLVEVAGGRARCASRAAAQRLRAGCSDPVGLHRKLLELLLERGGSSAFRVGWHVVHAGDAARAASMGAALITATKAEDRHEAARLADALWALAPAPSLAAARVEALAGAGQIDEAREAARAALATCPPAAQADVWIALAWLCSGRPDLLAEAADAAAQARALIAPDASDAASPLRVLAIEAQILFRADRPAEAGQKAGAAAGQPPPAAPDALDQWLGARLVWAQSRQKLGDLPGAVAVLEEVPPDLGAGRPARVVLQAALGRLLWHAGRLQDAAEVMERTAAASAGISAVERARMLNNAGLITYQCGDRSRALELWEDALLVFERLGSTVEQMYVCVNLCVGYREAGRWERARQSGVWAAEAAAGRYPEAEAMAAGNLGDLCLVQGQLPEARGWYHRARGLAEASGLAGELIELARRDAEVALRSESPDAFDLAKRAVAAAEAAENTLELARCRALLAWCAAQAGEAAPMDELLQQATEQLRGLGAACELAEVRLWAAESYLAVGRVQPAVAECERVKVYADEVGHVPLRTRANAILQRARQHAGPEDSIVNRLLRLAIAVSTERRLEVLLETIAGSALELLDGDRSFVLLVEDKASPYIVARQSREGAGGGGPSMSIVQSALSKRREVIAADLGERGDLREAQSVLAMDLRSAMCVPMIDGEELLGAIYVDSRARSSQGFAEAVLFMRALASHAAIAVSNARHLKSLERRALWAAEVAHDLKGPAAGILTLARTLEEPDLPHKRLVSGLTDIQKVARRSLDDIDRFLHQRPSQRRPIALDAVLVEALRLFSPRVRERGRHLAWHIPDPLPLVGDERELERVVANLLDNALKYCAADGTIQVEAIRSGEEIEIRVRNPGAAIPAAILPHLFERGYQAPGAAPGHGLGLAIAQQFVRAHGGRIAAENLGGEGVQFTVCLPLAVRAAA